MAKTIKAKKSIRAAQPAPMPVVVNSIRPVVLYKYSSLDNSEYFFDTIRNSHLYAGLFSEMNDPMEGTFQAKYEFRQDILDHIKGEKAMLRFCALAPSPYKMLMWSYYAKDHKGCCLEIEVPTSERYSLVKMKYNNRIPQVREATDESIKDLLCRKFTDWAHEEESRLFVSNGAQYIEGVKIRKIYFGSRVNEDLYEAYKHRINEINPEIEIEKMKRSTLSMQKYRIDTSDKIKEKQK